ncbi:hypothetical protein [Mycolicibacterium porcinum]|uniref:hypothetical protein n=1 Tax=Mycolicibacterium porcinum TaxID=39693 RepID=UPI00256EF545|nr:hypothetical protein [Mycolicibacterium porcinum]
MLEQGTGLGQQRHRVRPGDHGARRVCRAGVDEDHLFARRQVRWLYPVERIGDGVGIKPPGGDVAAHHAHSVEVVVDDPESPTWITSLANLSNPAIWHSRGRSIR